MSIYKLGYQWQRTEQQKIRFGASILSNPFHHLTFYLIF